MRRYMQGTLDFGCGIYAVINALSCTYSLDLADARTIFADTIDELSRHPSLWRGFLHNDTDHYWLVDWLLEYWCGDGRWQLEQQRPFPGPPRAAARVLEQAANFLPERNYPRGPSNTGEARAEAQSVWNAISAWFEAGPHNAKAAVLRFHRFMPGLDRPVVSHWTTVRAVNRETIFLHDASSESGALFELGRATLLPLLHQPPMLRIAPESLILLSRPKVRRFVNNTR